MAFILGITKGLHTVAVFRTFSRTSALLTSFYLFTIMLRLAYNFLNEIMQFLSFTCSSSHPENTPYVSYLFRSPYVTFHFIAFLFFEELDCRNIPSRLKWHPHFSNQSKITTQIRQIHLQFSQYVLVTC